METFITVRRRLFKKKIGLRFDMLAWSLLYTKYKVDINDLKKVNDFETKQIHCAAISYAIEHKQFIWFDIKDVTRWVNNMLLVDANNIKETIKESSVVISKLHKEMLDKQEKKK